MSIAEKLTTIAENTPKVFTAGYEKGKAEVIPAKAEQEKTIEITQNSTTEILPDENKTLSKVTVNVDVPTDEYVDDDFISNYASVVNFGAAVFPENTELDLKFEKLITLENFLYNAVNVVKAKIKANVLGNKISLLYFAYYNPLMTEIDISEINCNGKGFNAVNMANMFTTCRALKRIIGEINFTDALHTTKIFTNCVALEEVYFTANSLSQSLEIKHSPNLTDESIDSLVNAYADMTGQTSPVLTVHPDVKAKIEVNSEWLNTLINKNVTLA